MSGLTVDTGSGPLDSLRDVFIKALSYVDDIKEYDNLIQDWNDAIIYCQNVLEVKNK